MDRHGQVNEITARRKGRRGRVLPGVPQALQVLGASWAGTCKASCIQLLCDTDTASLGRDVVASSARVGTKIQSLY